MDPEDRTSDTDLVARIARRDGVALALLYDRHASAALALAMRVTGDRSEAEDLLQRAFVRLWAQAGRFDPSRGSVAGWLLSSLRSAAIDRVSRRETPRRAAEQREVIELAYFDGLSQAQIAERLRLPLGTVKTRIQMGMKRLGPAEGDGLCRDESKDLAPIYALGALDGGELAVFDAHLPGCAECRELVRQHEEASLAIGTALPPLEPPPELKPRILALAKGRPRIFLAAAAALVVVGGLTLLLRAFEGFDLAKARLRERSGTVIVKLTGTPELPGVDGMVFWNGREVAFESATLPALPAGKAGYGLWAIVAGKPEQAGFFPRDGQGRVRGLFELARAPSRVEAFALTREAGPGEAPTMPIVALAPLP